MKYVVIFKLDGPDERWQHVGAYDVPDDVLAADEPAVAVEALAHGDGVAVAIPWEDWIMYRVESRVTVERVPTKEEVEQHPEPEGERFTDDPDMAGLRRKGE